MADRMKKLEETLAQSIPMDTSIHQRSLQLSIFYFIEDAFNVFRQGEVNNESFYLNQ